MTPRLVERLSHRLSTAALIGPSSLDPVLTAASRRISDTLTGRLAPSLRPGETLIFAAGGGLGQLPIGLAEVSGRPLIASHSVALALTAQSAAWAQAESHARALDINDVVSFACPTPSSYPVLPAAVAESSAFTTPDQRRHGTAATSTALLQDSNRPTSSMSRLTPRSPATTRWPSTLSCRATNHCLPTRSSTPHRSVRA